MNIEALLTLKEALIKQHRDEPYSYYQNNVMMEDVDCGCAIRTHQIMTGDSSIITDMINIYFLTNIETYYLFGMDHDVEMASKKLNLPISGTWTAKDAADRIDALINSHD